MSLFGPSSSTDHGDPKSQFQRALRGLGVAHIVAPTPQAKGKIERRFGTFQNRIVTLLAHAKVKTYEHARATRQLWRCHKSPVATRRSHRRSTAPPRAGKPLFKVSLNKQIRPAEQKWLAEHRVFESVEDLKDALGI